MIIAFTKDWNDVPTCTTHILREMARTIPVLWVSSIGMRKPKATSRKDMRRILGRIISGLRRAEWKENNLRVLKPILIPKAESPFAKWLNRKIFAWYVRREVARLHGGKVTRWHGNRGREGDTLSSRENNRLHIQQPLTPNPEPLTLEYWCFMPNAVDLLPLPSSELGVPGSVFTDSNQKRNSERLTRNSEPGTRIVYYCADDWGQFHNLDGAWMDAKERELVSRADAVFVTSRFLEEKFGAGGREQGDGEQKEPGTRNPELGTILHYLPHGVEYARFAQALDKTLPMPDDVAELPKPVIGFYGNLHPWVDFKIIAELAIARPEWSIVLIGEKYADVTELEALSNIHLLGRREHSCLHNYCRAFDVAIIPYDMSNPRMESVNPVKTKELLAAGLPIVAADVPELRNYGDDVLTCAGADAWLAALERQLARTDQNEISERVRSESWQDKVATIREIVDGLGEFRG